MDYYSAIILGVVQGLTEFLPISSTGHLILARELFGLSLYGGLSFDALLHFATALAILVYMRREILTLLYSLWEWIIHRTIGDKERILLLAIILGTIPAVILGLFLENLINTSFRNPDIVAVILIAGSVFFIVAEKFSKKDKTISIKKGVWLGCFQAIALLPGASRSGMVIAGGLFLGLKREDSARFAFLLGVPILLGAGSKKMIDLGASDFFSDFGSVALVGSITAFIVGFAVIHYLLKFLRNHTLNIFAVYRIALAVVVLLLL
jgi:undecaprenyl-diphosphatase